MIHLRTATRYTRLMWCATIGLGLAAIAQTGCRGINHPDVDLAATALTVSCLGSDATGGTSVALPNGAEKGESSFKASVGQNGPTANVGPFILQAGLSESSDQPSNCVPGQSAQANVIDLSVALRLAGVDNPTIELAQEQVREALAGQLAARSLLIPSVNVGGNYHRHTGPLQDDPGNMLTPTSQDLYLGAGAGAIGSGTVTIPGVWLFAHLGDALYEPLAARQRVVGRQSEAQAVRNAVLLKVATAYLELVGAEGRLELLRRAESEVTEIVRITAEFAKTGQGTPPDANRAAANAELVRRQLYEAEGGVASASARLSQLVTIDPSDQLHTPGGSVQPFRLVAEESEPESLVAVAIQSRPELLTQSAAVQEAQIRVRQERIRPWLPLVAVGYSGGLFGGGSNLVADDFSPLKGRWDLDVMAVWTIQNLGVGNHARVLRAGTLIGQAFAEYDIAVNQIRRDVAEAQAAAKTAARQIEVAKAAVTTAEEGFRLEADRIKLGQGRPIEALDSFRQLLDARQELLRAIVAFDIAQFQLFVALGNTPVSGN